MKKSAKVKETSKESLIWNKNGKLSWYAWWDVRLDYWNSASCFLPFQVLIDKESSFFQTCKIVQNNWNYFADVSSIWWWKRKKLMACAKPSQTFVYTSGCPNFLLFPHCLLIWKTLMLVKVLHDISTSNIRRWILLLSKIIVL